MQDCVELILGLGLCWGRFSDNDFIGRRQLRMQRTGFKNVKTTISVSETRTTFVLNPTNIAHLATAKVGPRSARSTSTSTR
jgi:hypothetical protein